MDSAFLSELDVRVVDDSQGRPRYQLLAAFGFWSREQEREHWVPVGYEFDGPSIPQVLLWASGAAPGLRASCVHDWLITSRSVDRRTADRIFREALHVCGVEAQLAETMYQAVRAYSRSLEPVAEHYNPGGNGG
jgi:hypothetical protein